MAVPEWSCWQCGAPVFPPWAGDWRDAAHYFCDACDVVYASSAQVRDIFTDPEVMQDQGYIDHATVHMPSPA